MNRARILAAIVAGSTLVAVGGSAWAYWTATDAGHAAQASADTLPAGQAATGSVTYAHGSNTVTLSVPRGTPASGRSVTAFVIARYPAAAGGSPAASFTCTDTGAGATATCTETNVPLQGTWYYSDAPAIANGSTAVWTGTASSRSAVSFDTTAPSVGYSQSPAANANGYNNTSVSVTLTATDAAGGSGVDYVSYAVDGGPITKVNGTTATFTLSADGTHTVTYSATDNAGNTSTPASQTVKIDTTAPAGLTVSCKAGNLAGDATAISVKLTSPGQPAVTLTGTRSGSTWTSDTGSIAKNKTWTATATQTDLAGNTSTATSTFSS